MATANNPFDLNTTTGNKLLGAAQTAVASPQATGYNAVTAGATGYNATQANPFGYDASAATSQGYDATNAGATGYNAATTGATGYNASTAGSTGYNASDAGAAGYNAGSRDAAGYTAGQALGTNWNVDPNNQTVQGQIGGIIASNSPLLRQAQANALAQMNARGLTNSSMAVGAGQQALYSAALPIAQSDAATYANAGQFNANSANQMAQFNTGQGNAGLQFNAAAINQAGAENLAGSNQAAQFTAGASNQAALTNAGAANQAVSVNVLSLSGTTVDSTAFTNTTLSGSGDVTTVGITALSSTLGVVSYTDISTNYATVNAFTISGGIVSAMGVEAQISTSAGYGTSLAALSSSSFVCAAGGGISNNLRGSRYR